VRLRPRPSPPSPAPADRVRDLLATGGRGWVPPPEPGTGALHEGEERDHGTPADDEAWGPGPDSSWQPRPANAGRAGPGRSDPGRSNPVEAVPVRVGAGRSDPVGAGGRYGSLPRTRLAPSWRAGAALVVVALLAALVAGGVVLRGRPQEVVAPDVVDNGVAPLGAPATTPAAETGEVVVAVAGKVARPGLVRLPAGSRVDDAVRAAGGALPGADVALLNLARKLVDGEQVLVGVDPPAGAPAAPTAGPAASGLVNLNTATAADLDALPGIGPVLAQRIVQWRSEHGRFARVEQLREVTGIGEATCVR
jgi:competence protein ComEA